MAVPPSLRSKTLSVSFVAHSLRTVSRLDLTWCVRSTGPLRDRALFTDSSGGEVHGPARRPFLSVLFVFPVSLGIQRPQSYVVNRQSSFHLRP